MGITGTLYCPDCGDWRDVSISKRSEDGATRHCAVHRTARTPTIGRKFTDANGYVRIRVGSGRKGIVYEHRWVWEQANGPVPDGHHIHHRNHRRDDNRLDNLVLVAVSQHLSYHSTERHKEGTLNNRGRNSPRYRLDLDDAEIVYRRDSGQSFRSIGRDLGVAHNVISNHYRRAKERVVN